MLKIDWSQKIPKSSNLQATTSVHSQTLIRAHVKFVLPISFGIFFVLLSRTQLTRPRYLFCRPQDSRLVIERVHRETNQVIPSPCSGGIDDISSERRIIVFGENYRWVSAKDYIWRKFLSCSSLAYFSMDLAESFDDNYGRKLSDIGQLESAVSKSQFQRFR